MHAATIQDHESFQRQARELVFSWKGTDPMTTEAEVRLALEATGANTDAFDAIMPYLMDACREAGLLVEPVEYFAAIGTDGRDPVVWGLGGSAAGALADARLELRRADENEAQATTFRCVQVSKDRARVIRNGDVRADDL